MEKSTIITVLTVQLLTSFSTSVPLPEPESMYDFIKASEGNKDLKCSYLQENFLKKEFLDGCLPPSKAHSNSQMPCVLFYNNYMKLCSVSNDTITKKLLNQSTVNTFSSSINSTCNNLQSAVPYSKSLEEGLKKIVKFMNVSCPAICLDGFENKVYPVCSISATMNFVITQLVKQLQNVKNSPPEIVEKKIVQQITPKENPKETKTLVSQPPEMSSKETQQEIAKKDPIIEETKPSSDAKPEDQSKKGVASDAKAETALKDNLKPQEVPKAAVPKTIEHEKDSVKKTPEKSPTDKIDKTQEAAPKNQHPIESPQFNQPQDSVPDDISMELQDEDEDINEKNQLGQFEEPESNKHNIVHPEQDKKVKPKATNEDENPANVNSSGQMEEEDSFFFVYFMMVCAVFILGYIGYHNKQKVLALVIEGRRGRRPSRRGGRPNSANYHKLDSNLEEAVTSSVHKNTTNIIY